MNDIIKALMDRDNITLEEATDIFKDLKRQVSDLLDDGGDYDEVQDLLMDEVGLEMDCVIDLM